MSVFWSRAGCFLGLWIILDGLDVGGFVLGCATALTASRVSLRLLPGQGWRPRPIALALFGLRFLRQSVIAGADIAWRALSPGMPLRPGFVLYPTRLPEGHPRSVFRMLASLLPGSLPAGPEAQGRVPVHLLDTARPALAELADEEARFSHTFGVSQADTRESHG